MFIGCHVKAHRTKGAVMKNFDPLKKSIFWSYIFSLHFSINFNKVQEKKNQERIFFVYFFFIKKCRSLMLFTSRKSTGDEK
jgi:hypothetical protein